VAPRGWCEALDAGKLFDVEMSKFALVTYAGEARSSGNNKLVVARDFSADE
jgi:cellobiose-specific phosphotransferase system component IIA